MASRPNFVARVASRIARARKLKGVTQEALAERIGTSTRAIQRMESGRQNFTLKFLERVAKALEAEPEKLLGHD